MERLRLHAYVTACLLLITAAWAQFSPRPGKVAGKTEAWMEQVAPATLVTLTTPDGKPSVAVYFYKGPRGYYGSTMQFKLALLKDQLMGRADLDGIFFRFIPEGEMTQSTQAQLIQFISHYIETAE